MGKRANIKATAQNTATLVQYERRRELIEQGHLAPSASLADAAAMNRELARIHREDTADPRATAITGAVLTAIAGLIALFALSGAWAILTLIAAVLSVGAYARAVGEVQRREARTLR